MPASPQDRAAAASRILIAREPDPRLRWETRDTATALILIIDDSSFQRRMLREWVQAAGHETDEAADGLAGLAQLEERQPAIILSDLLMPRMGGLELLETLADVGSTIPIIIITSNKQATVRERCLSLGAVAVVHKPPNAEELLTLIGEILEQQAGKG